MGGTTLLITVVCYFAIVELTIIAMGIKILRQYKNIHYSLNSLTDKVTCAYTDKSGKDNK